MLFFCVIRNVIKIQNRLGMKWQMRYFYGIIPISSTMLYADFSRKANCNSRISNFLQFRHKHSDYHQSVKKETDLEFGEVLLKEIRNGASEEQLHVLRKQLSGILYRLYLKKDETLLLAFFDKLSQQNALNEASYTIIMRYYADQNDFKNVKCIYNLALENREVEVHARIFVPLVLVCLKLDHFDLAKAYFNELVAAMKVRYNDRMFVDILNTCTEIRSLQNDGDVNSLVEEIFRIFEDYGSVNLHSESVEAITRWFESDPSGKWHFQKTSMGKKNGMCQFCKKRLEETSIPEERLVQLKRNLTILVKRKVHKQPRITDLKHLKTSNNLKDNVKKNSNYLERYQQTYEIVAGKTNERPGNKASTAVDNMFGFDAKLKSLKTLLETSDPFDIVIDALNSGYYMHGFRPQQVHDVVKIFVEQKKRILIFNAGILKQELLTTENVPPANRRIQQLMLYLQQHCTLFYVESSVVDDYYMLYTLIHHNFNIELVSRDLFRDHLFHLDAQNVTDFQRWQRVNQYIQKAIRPDGSPVFKARSKFNHAMQRHVNGWHLPVGDNVWLCISKSDAQSAQQ